MSRSANIFGMALAWLCAPIALILVLSLIGLADQRYQNEKSQRHNCFKHATTAPEAEQCRN